MLFETKSEVDIHEMSPLALAIHHLCHFNSLLNYH